jgi:hypothetical protein
MNRQTQKQKSPAAERQAIRRQVRRLYGWFNRQDWPKCFEFLDPKLREADRVQLGPYAESLTAFQQVYGSVQVWLLRVSLHLDTRGSKLDQRPFAYVYVIWKDERQAFHLFRERWVKQEGRWYTRVVGLIPYREPGRED